MENKPPPYGQNSNKEFPNSQDESTQRAIELQKELIDNKQKQIADLNSDIQTALRLIEFLTAKQTSVSSPERIKTTIDQTPNKNTILEILSTSPIAGMSSKEISLQTVDGTTGANWSAVNRIIKLLLEEDLIYQTNHPNKRNKKFRIKEQDTNLF